MSRKDYVAVAAALKDLKDAEYDSKTLFRTAVRLADVFADDNSNFDRQRFYDAAGLDS